MNIQRFESELLIVKKKKVSAGTIRLSGDLSIQDAVALKTAILDALSKVDTCKLDLSLVNYFDLSSIQILYAAHKLALAKNKIFKLDGECPKIFNHAVVEAGFGAIDWLCFKP